MTQQLFDITFSSEAETTDFARRLAGRVGAGDVILLEGSIGAGKTHFARSLIKAKLSEPEDIPSPTFTLVQVYNEGDLDIWHSDLYRLTHPDEAVELGLTDAFETALCLVEWPDRLGDLLPADALVLSFSQGSTDESRRVIARSESPQWRARLERLND
ncbi:tRNA (adenosine(37)-N6)-threonylcarbamoyltransferase complex ATPase subunit type 1 TsaE [Pseudogemmobacter sp. W21_MBD1_M6]|uniref:tRNA (adenosine(37)-N6)-threonylcarbamoyltransferase complex ATPase subunit type 1 TsaE n=1 Tax=Pseudogemmobacter sp. W21_MBD1_M6 TaxID=3240271 RepID=UPI003F9BE504